MFYEQDNDQADEGNWLGFGSGNNNDLADEEVQLLQQAWQTEVHCPEVLPFKKDRITSRLADQQVCVCVLPPLQPCMEHNNITFFVAHDLCDIFA